MPDDKSIDVHGTGVTWAALAAIALSLSALTGCGSLRLYSETRDKQGTEAKEAWAKVDLGMMVTTERANLKKLLDLELETQDQLATGIRNDRLRDLVEGKVGEDLVKPTNVLLNRLVGPADGFQKVQETLSDLRLKSRRLQEKRDAFKGLPFVAPSCDEVKDGSVPARIETAISTLPPGRQAVVKALVEELATTCKEVGAAGGTEAGTVKAYKRLGGEMAAAVERYEKDKAALDEARGKDAPLKAAYKAARDEYDKAVAEYERDSTLLAKVQERASAVREAAAGLAGLQDAFAVELLAEGRLKSIDSFFNTVASTDPAADLPKDANRTAAALVLLPDLVDKSREALAEAKKPLAYPLLMRRNYEQLRLEAAKREIAARQAMVDLSRDLMDAIYLEAGQLSNAAASFRDAKVGEDSSVTMLAAFGARNTDKNQKELLYNGAGRYLDALNRLEARRYKLQYMRIAATHERALAYSEVNLKQWESLIGTTVNQVGDYSAGGIKSQDIMDLINAAALIYIGVGVNK
jgi:hypothetical protein